MKQLRCMVQDYPTNILVSGNSVDLGNKICAGLKTSGERVKKCVFLVPGNPGGLSYYVPFCEQMESKLGEDVCMMAIDHAGHCRGSSLSETFSGIFFPAGLGDQMEQKRAFVENHLPSAEKLVVIGHSIGALMMLDLIPRLKSSGRFGSVTGIGLFPTIERMAVSPMGLKMSRYFAYFRWLFAFLAGMFNMFFPRVLRLKLLRWYFGPKVEESSIAATDDILCARAVSGISYMAHDEMRMVRELNVKQLRQLSDSVFLYYGSRDAWTPVRYFEEMKQVVPEACARVCDKGFAHAFVLRHSSGVADECASWIRQIFESNNPSEAIKKLAVVDQK